MNLHMIRSPATKSYIFTVLVTIAILVAVALSCYAAVEEYEAVKVAAPFTIDGDLGDWSGVKGVSLTGSIEVTGTVDDKDVYKDWETLGQETWESDADMSVTWYAAWDADNFYFACKVRDEKHDNAQAGGNIWNGDSIQFTIDPLNARGEYANHVYEYGYALTMKPEVWRWYTHTATAGENSTFAIVRDAKVGTTTYELAIPKDDIAPVELIAGNVVGFSFVANENDSSGRQGGWLGWGAHAIVYDKSAHKLNNLTFSAEIATAR